MAVKSECLPDAVNIHFWVCGKVLDVLRLEAVYLYICVLSLFERALIFSEDKKLKKINVFLSFLAVLLVLGGCSRSVTQDTTAVFTSPAATEYITESTEAVTVTEAEVSFTETQTTVSATTAQPTTVQTAKTTAETRTEAVITTTQTQSSTTAVNTVTSSETEIQTQPQEKATNAGLFGSIFGGKSDSNKKNTTSKKQENNGKSVNTCFVTIRCETVRNNLSSLKKGKEAFVPKSGVILDKTEVEFKNGESAFDVIKRACSENVCTDNCKYCRKGGIQLEYNFTPAFGSYYVEGIHQLYEKDCGSMSGWMFSVNGEFPTDSSSSYAVKKGDDIVFAYTCDMGDDIGNAY